ncbi:MAG: LysE family transporter [Kiritimatiellae bacterium]|nr:LysE family transporter [Kiritimatiellia bacterium]
MPLDLLPALMLSIVLVGYSPGPANLFALSMVLRHGRAGALQMWLGLLAGYSCAAAICVVAVHFAGLAFGSWIGHIRYLGAAYLLWMAYGVYAARGQASARHGTCSFWSGFVVQMTNAKMLLFEMTVYSSFVLPYSDRLADLFVVAALLTLAGPGGNLAWLLAGSFLQGLFARHRRTADVLTACCLAACALWIALA